VARDGREGRITAQDAVSVYGVVIDAAGAVDPAATPVCRAELLRDRLRRAKPADKPMPQDQPIMASQRGHGLPWYPGVEQHGSTAYSVLSGATLAVSPDHWTDGCPMVEERRERLLIRSYLDPLTGRLLLVEALPAGEARAIDTRPARWTNAAPAGVLQPAP
jgi:N-methylhydantoinase B